MGIFRRRPKRRVPEEWPFPVIAEQVVAAFMTDPDDDDVRGAAVLHLEPELLPGNWQEIVRQVAAAEGETVERVSDYFVYGMAFDDEDRVGLFMDHDATTVIRQHQQADSLSGATARAREWVATEGQEAFEVPFAFLPNVFQYALMTEVRGDYLEPVPAYFMWVPADPRGGSENVAVRRFPPEAQSGGESEGAWSVLPAAVVQEMLAERGW